MTQSNDGTTIFNICAWCRFHLFVNGVSVLSVSLNCRSTCGATSEAVSYNESIKLSGFMLSHWNSCTATAWSLINISKKTHLAVQHFLQKGNTWITAEHSSSKIRNDFYSVYSAQGLLGTAWIHLFLHQLK